MNKEDKNTCTCDDYPFEDCEIPLWVYVVLLGFMLLAIGMIYWGLSSPV